MEILKQCKTDAIKYVDQILLKKKESEAISGELREIKLCHKNPESQYCLTREKREMNQLQQEHYSEDIDNDQSNFSEFGLI